MILLGIFDMFTRCDGKTALGFIPFLLVAGLLGYLLKHFMGGNNNKLKEYEAQLGDWQGKYTTLQNDYKGYKSSITASARDNDKQVGDLTNRVKSLEADIRNLADEKNKLHVSLTEKQTDLGGYTRKISTLEETIASINEEKNKLNADWSARLSVVNDSLSKASTWEGRVRQVEEELARAKATVSDANKKQVEAEMRLKTTSEVAGKVVPLETELKNWKDKYAALEIQLHEKESSATAYGAKLTDAETKHKNLLDENSQLKLSVGEWEAKWKIANEAAGKITGLEAEIKSLKDNNAAIQLNFQEKDKSIAEWEAKWKIANEASGKLSGLESELANWKNKHDALQGQLSSNASAAGEWNSKFEALTNENSELKNDLDGRNKYAVDLEGKLKTAETNAARIGGLEKDVMDWRTKYESLSAELNARKASFAELEEKLALAMQPKRRDDLTKIEGVGPKINDLLHAGGISTFEELANTTPGHIQSILHAEGAQYKIHDPSTLTWPRQARMAADGKWAELKKWQDESLTVGREDGLAAIPEKKDDLTKIEGIGPKINELLNNAGIYTFVKLSSTKYEKLKNILEDAGERFRMHDPTTWPKQADIAAQGKWEELKKLQDELKGGKI
jgi:predicted flap endonuclease-1-like 5' DNA nuclease